MAATEQRPGFARRLGLFDATMIVMGGIIGSGIFMNPAVVARIVHTPALILSAWFAGGLIALAGAFIYAELSARRPAVGGSYAYLREAFHPVVAFMFAWSLLLVSDTGGMAAVAMTFARYLIELTGAPFSDTVIAISALAILTVINCFGVRAGSNVQNTLMVVKIAAILMLVAVGFLWAPAKDAAAASVPAAGTAPQDGFGLLTTFGAGMVPVLFAYGGWQTACFIAGEVKEPRKNLPRGLLIGTVGVVALYLAVNEVCLRVLGADGLAATSTPASQVMRAALGETGARLIAIGIAVSTLGFLSQCILVAPRVYFAMADDGLFFKSVARIHPRTHVPVLAIAVQGLLAMAITLSGKYEDILNYVVVDDFVFFGLTAACIFILRRRVTARDPQEEAYNMPGHPWTTLLFIAVCIFVVGNTLYTSPTYALMSVAVILGGIPVYYFWRWWNRP
jgi:APA family basic amino acid/polyamine antiporter